jgi:hypothetical protein
MNGVMVTGGLITAYGISTIIWDLTSLFINLTPAATGYYGFFGGLTTASIIGGLMYYVERWYTIRPHAVFRMSLGRYSILVLFMHVFSEDALLSLLSCLFLNFLYQVLLFISIF